jgi:hypothetical protein
MTSLENCDDITKFFYIMYDSLIITKNQNKFAGNLSGLLRNFNFTNFKNIINIKILILNLKKEYTFAYKLCLLSYIKCDLFYKIIILFPHIFGDNVTPTDQNSLELVTKKNNKVHDDLFYIEAFDLYSYKLSKSEESVDNAKTTSNVWQFETRIEIINSLVLLVEYFTHDILKHMNVKLITYAETKEMTFKQLSKYYNKQVLVIKKSLKKCKQYCDSYIEVEKSFVMALLTCDDTIYFDDFDVVIETKNTTYDQNSEHVVEDDSETENEFNIFEQEFGELVNSFTTTDDNFDNFDSIDDNFDSIDDNFDSIDDNFDSIDDNFDSIDDNFDSIDDSIDDSII